MIREVNGVEINCPICYEDVVDFTIETKCKHYFCAGCIKLWLEKNNDCPYCRVSLKQTTGEICVKEDPELTNLLIELKEKTSYIRYKCYNIELFDSTFSDPNFITVIHEDSIEQYKNDILFIINSLKNIKTHVDKKKYVNNFIKIFLNRLWEFYYTNFYDIFAEISYGYCITVHKSQGSTFKDVFVDFKNILNVNYEFKDKYKCLYTAIWVCRISKYIIIMGNLFCKKKPHNLLEQPLIDSFEIDTFRDNIQNDLLLVSHRLNAKENSQTHMLIEELSDKVNGQKIHIINLENENQILKEKISTIETAINKNVNSRFFNIENQCEKSI